MENSTFGSGPPPSPRRGKNKVIFSETRPFFAWTFTKDSL